VIRFLNQHLADAIDLQTQCKQARWNVRGATFIALHKLLTTSTLMPWSKYSMAS